MTKADLIRLLENVPDSSKVVIVQDTADGLNVMAVISIKHIIKICPDPETHEIHIEIPDEA